MARALWLPQTLRAAGLTVHEQPGWKERGHPTFTPQGIICHATAGSPSSTDGGEIRVLLQGSASAPPPIAQLYLSRTGQWWVIASGRCNHALQGWSGPLKGLGNSSLIGVEAQNDNRGQPWPKAQYDSYVRGVAAICRRQAWSASKVAGHKEHQPGAKTDPTFNMTAFRAAVTATLTGNFGTTSTPEGAPDMLADERQMLINVHTWLHGLTRGLIQPDPGTPHITRYVPNDLLNQLTAAATTSAQREQDMLAALTALTAGGSSIDTAAVITAIEARSADVTGMLAAQAERIAALETELAEHHGREAAAAQAAADALTD